MTTMTGNVPSQLQGLSFVSASLETMAGRHSETQKRIIELTKKITTIADDLHGSVDSVPTAEEKDAPVGQGRIDSLELSMTKLEVTLTDLEHEISRLGIA